MRQLHEIMVFQGKSIRLSRCHLIMLGNAIQPCNFLLKSPQAAIALFCRCRRPQLWQTCRDASDANFRMCVEPSGSRIRSAVVPVLPAAGSGFSAARLLTRLAASMAALSAMRFASASCAALYGHTYSTPS